MIVVLPGRTGPDEPWRLVSRTDGRADLLAQLRRPGGWRRAAERIRDLDGELDVVQVKDGHFRWVLRDERRAVVAASPAVFRDEPSCRHAFIDARRAARVLVGEGHQQHP